LQAAEDYTYQQVVLALRHGKDVQSLPPHHPAHLYKNVWGRLGLLDNSDRTLVILDGTRIVVPESMRRDVLKLLHLPHQGVVKTRKAAQQLYFWPGMTNNIKMMVESCTICQEKLPSQSVEAALEGDFPELPMDAVGVDLFDVAGNTWLLMVCRFSGFPFIRKLKKLDTAAVTLVLKQWFVDFGFPRSIRTDGGPQFRSDFGAFCEEFKIKHELSSPYNPRSNGLAESNVKSMKAMVSKCLEMEEDIELALMEFRNTPRADGFSPAQMMFCRRQRSQLPTLASARNFIDVDEATQKRHLSEEGEENNKRELHPLTIGMTVRIQNPITKLWDSVGTIESVRENGRSYFVNKDGKSILRNRRFLRPMTIAASDTDSAELDTVFEEKTAPRRSLRIAQREKGEKKRVHFA